MGIFEWLRNRFGSSESRETVPFLDVESGSVIEIPRRELSSNAVQVQLQGRQGLVWVEAGSLKPGEIKHEPFDEEIRQYLRHIQSSFAEHRNLTLEQWEDGFRRDSAPEREIALWSYAADVYLEFAADEVELLRRRDIYRCIIACMTTTPSTVWDVLRLETLDRNEAGAVVKRFYRKEDV